MDHDELSTLQAFSDGEISWREACRRLGLMDMGELEEALAEAGLFLPKSQPVPTEETEALYQRLSSFVKGEDDT